MGLDDRKQSRDPAAGLSPVRHWGGFLASGGIAFTVDAAVMEALVRLGGVPALGARLAGVGCAMVAAWLAHRALTFAVRSQPTLSEFGKYAAAATTTALVNYAVFAGILLLWPQTVRLGALVAASCVATIFAYVSMRYAVFRRG